MSLAVTDILAAITAILLLIFAFFTVTLKNGKRLSSLLLFAFLLSNALFIIDFLIPFIQKSLNISFSLFDGVGFAFGFLFGPLLFLFTRSLTNKELKFKRIQFFHFVLFTVSLVITITHTSIPWQLQYSALHLQLIPYMVACIIVIVSYTKRLKEYFSSIVKLNLTWMFYVVGGFFLMWMIDLANFILSEAGLSNETLYSFFLFISIFINFVFAVLIFYKALQHPEFFAEYAGAVKTHKYEGSKISSEEKKVYLVKILSYFEKEKPFLNPTLTISDVAEVTGINTKYISQVINESLNKNFYDFINSYRIEEAKMKLRENGKNGKTVLEILYDSGFNSKSAFNSAFKKLTGVTPTHYRKNDLQA